VTCKNGLKRKNLQRKAGLASNKKERQKNIFFLTPKDT
jgi:hypothetical protein